MADVCQGGVVRVAHNPSDMEVDNGTNEIVLKPMAPLGSKYRSAWPYEVLSTFVHENQLIPTYIKPDNYYSYWDEVAGEWTGIVGMVRENILIVIFQAHV